MISDANSRFSASGNFSTESNSSSPDLVIPFNPATSLASWQPTTRDTTRVIINVLTIRFRIFSSRTHLIRITILPLSRERRESYPVVCLPPSRAAHRSAAC